MSESKKQQKHFYLRNNDALMNSTKLSMKAKQSILLSKAEILLMLTNRIGTIS